MAPPIHQGPHCSCLLIAVRLFVDTETKKARALEQRGKPRCASRIVGKIALKTYETKWWTFPEKGFQVGRKVPGPACRQGGATGSQGSGRLSHPFRGWKMVPFSQLICQKSSPLDCP